MKNVGFVANSQKDIDLEFTAKLMMWVFNKNCQVLISEHGSKIPNVARLCSADVLYSESDFIVVLGGDGTMLRSAAEAAVYNTPLLGINLGNLGYLTDVEKSCAEVAINKVLNNKYKIQRRMMLETDFNQIALNDICVSKADTSKMIQFEMYINDEYIDSYRADGIIISTPTGSTAYSLSAGGPILKPDGEMIAITPVCAHMLYAKSFVISADDKISICISGHGQGMISMDGENKRLMNDGDTVEIKRSNLYASIIKTNNLGFYEILRKKMVY